MDVRDSDDPHFHCFSCSEHGDVIDLVMRLESCSFGEACERLTSRRRPQRVGDGIGATTPKSPGRRWDLIAPGSAEARLLDVAGAVFVDGLHTNPRAQQYLAKRGVSLDIARAQRVGYADGRLLLHRVRGQRREQPGPSPGDSRRAGVAARAGDEGYLSSSRPVTAASREPAVR